MFTEEVKSSIHQSVLCWLATVDKDGAPSVSPKEVFVSYKDNELIIANIASANSVRNIKHNDNVCVSCVDVFTQKGFQLYGKASYVAKSDSHFPVLFKEIVPITGDKYPVAGIIHITVNKVKPIVAPSYKLFPNITEAEQIESAKVTYGVK
ncbi:pyridoxamine 5'-phosphate oxidase family protein [Pseudoalteromonas luteoviolacea]|uniref:pyridoxamine 5'-phosphate oxidase family protein n=1 Tax=Pseudoalteromonas luteoviolacea TaxID=43657 RepID=UPI001F17C6F8|nr:pyridoxamine 5'-phosphate oxidase family protein [Pseudoalteromonas luteoviolacea]MCF6442642.1 pyridoxamine 5'-phosphate oxidase family protein [Pseudoalteromonas luteoviolacea]